MTRFKRQLTFILGGAAIIAVGVLSVVAYNNRGSDPALWLRFDEGYASTSYDGSGNGNNGTLTGGVAWQQENDCVSGKCLYLDGTDDYVDTGNSSTTIQTISFWARSASTTYSVLELANNTVYVRVASGIATTTGIVSPIIYVNGATSSAITANQWNFVVITTETAADATSTNIGEARGEYYVGSIDEVKLYSYARSAPQIKADYQKGAGKYGASIRVASDAQARDVSEGLQGYWKFDDTTWASTSASALDSSGNAKHGTPKLEAATSSSAKFGSSCSLDGVDDYIDVGDIDF